MPDEFLIDVGPIGQDHVSKGAPVLVLAKGLKRDFPPKGEVRGRVLGSLAVGLTLLWAVNAAETDTFRTLVVQNFEGVAVENTDHWAIW
jgi:hypothetical protein